MPDIADQSWAEKDDRNDEVVPFGWTDTMPANVAQTGRMMMGAIKRFWDRSNPVYLTSGTADSFVVMPQAPVSNIHLYEIYRVRFDRSNSTATPTFQFGNTTPRTIVKYAASGIVPLLAGDIVAGSDHCLWNNGTQYVLSDPMPSPAAIGAVASVAAGNGIAVDSTDPQHPVVAINTVVTVDKTTAQTLQNKIIDTASGNSILINGVAATSNTGTGAVVRANSPALVTPALGTPSSVVLTNATGLPIGTGVSGLATNMATFLAGGASAQLAAAVSDETGSGSLVFGTAPTFTTSITDPLVIGGTGVGSSLTLQSTSGIGSADFIDVLVGNNGATQGARFDTSGNAIFGYSTAMSVLNEGGTPAIPPLQSQAGVQSGFGLFRWDNSANPARMYFAKSRGASIGTHATLQASDTIGGLLWDGDDGTNFVAAAGIFSTVDGTPGSGSMPGKLSLRTTPTGTNTPTERLSINAVGFHSIVGSLGRGAPVTKTADFSVATTENNLINNKSGSTCTATLPSAATFPGREILIKNAQAQTVVSASSNVVPLITAAASTAILASGSGKWAVLVSDGTNWVIMAGN